MEGDAGRDGSRTIEGPRSRPDAHDEHRSVEDVIGALDRGEEVDFRCFWGHWQSDAVGSTCLSQWYASRFEVDGIVYPTAEHFMMAEKARLFGDDGALRAVLGTDDPGAAKRIGRTVAGFDESVWVLHRCRIVLEASLHKFAQSAPIASYLLSTGTAVLVEASPHDKVWGVGLGADHAERLGPRGWRGLNLLGFALMEARRRLRARSDTAG